MFENLQTGVVTRSFVLLLGMTFDIIIEAIPPVYPMYLIADDSPW